MTTSAQSIQITPSAVFKTWHMLQDEENPEQFLRVYVMGGGCSGFQYGFKFEREQQPGDCLVTRICTQKEIGKKADAVANFPAQGCEVKVLVDDISIQYLMGSEVDYVEGLQGAHYTVNNPNASTVCGCGSSFSV